MSKMTECGNNVNNRIYYVIEVHFIDLTFADT